MAVLPAVCTTGIMFRRVYRTCAVLSACTGGKTPTSNNSKYKKKYLGNQRPQNPKYATGRKKGSLRDLSKPWSLEQEGAFRWQRLYDCRKRHAQATWKVISHHPLLQIYPTWGIFLPDLKPVSQRDSRMQARDTNPSPESAPWTAGSTALWPVSDQKPSQLSIWQILDPHLHQQYL